MESIIVLAPPWVQELLGWFMSGEGRLTAAAALWVTFLLIKKGPRLPFMKVSIGEWIESRLPTKEQKRLFILILSMLPAAVGGLVSPLPMKELLITGALAFAGSLGLNQVITSWFPALGGADNPWVKIGESFIQKGITRHQLEESAKAAIDAKAKEVEASLDSLPDPEVVPPAKESQP